jgi:hypothetical protein
VLIVQITLNAKFTVANCSDTYAAIRKSDEHLISVILAAYMAGKTVQVQLNNKDTYHDGSRCIITDVLVKP